MRNEKSVSKGKKLGLAEILAGLILLVIVSVFAVRSDLASAQIRLCDTVTYIKEQCNNNLRLDIASESKSLMRMIESAELLEVQITEKEEQGEMTEKLLEQYI